MIPENETISSAGIDSNPWEWLSAILPTADWTMQAIAGTLAPSIVSPRTLFSSDTVSKCQAGRHPFHEAIVRILYRRRFPHVLITGPPGVGKTKAIQELARISAIGEIPTLTGQRFLWVDTTNVGREDSRACLESIVTALHPLDQVVLCLDGIDSLVRRSGGGSNKPLIRALASRPCLNIIGILNRWSFNELFAGDAQLNEIFERIDVDEPSESVAIQVLRHEAANLAQEYDLQIDESVIKRTFGLASNYLLSEHQPAKSLRLLRQACDETDYESTQLGNVPRAIEISTVTRILSARTGIPLTTLAAR